MGRHFGYPAKIEKDSAGFFLVTFPDFPEAATDARTLHAAISEATDCLEEAVAGRMKRGEDIPAPSPPATGWVIITLPTLYAMKAALYLALREQQLSQTALAAKLAKDEKRSGEAARSEARKQHFLNRSSFACDWKARPNSGRKRRVIGAHGDVRLPCSFAVIEM